MKLNSFVFSARKGETKIVLLSALLLFAVTSAFIVLKSARDALFLSHYSARILPYFMAITPLATALVSTFYLRLYVMFSLRDSVDLSLKGFVAGTFLLWIATKMEWRYATPLLYIWVGVFGSLAPVQSWSVIGQQLLTRQAKRAFGIIGAGGIAGASAGGFITKWVTDAIGVSSLLPAAMILILFALLILPKLSHVTAKKPEAEKKTSAAPILSRYAIYVLIIVGVASITTTWADFQFKVIAQSKLSTASALASFFGAFNAYINIATLVFQVFLTPLLMKRLGVASALALLPFGLAIGNGWIMISASLAAAVILKGSEQLFRFSVYRSSLEVLYLLVPESIKVRLKSLIDTVTVRSTEGLAGLLLILFFSVARLPLSFLATCSLILLAVSLACSYLLNREYRHTLSNAIRHEEIDISKLSEEFSKSDFVQWLPDLLKRSDTETVLHFLRGLRTAGNNHLQEYLAPLLQHQEAEIRLKALQMLFDEKEDLSEKIQYLTADPDRRIRVEAIHYLCSRSSIDPMQRLPQLMIDPEPAIQAAACVCSINLTGGASQMAAKRLEQLLSESSPSLVETRLEVAHILEYVKPTEWILAVYRRLLSDSTVEVRRAAMQSIAQTTPDGILREVAQSLSDASLRTEVRNALAAYKELAIPHLKDVLADKNVPLDSKKMALRIAADIGSAQAVILLMKSALGPNLVFRFVAIKGLNRIKKRGDQILPANALHGLLDQEITALEVEQQRRSYIASDSKSLLYSVLNQRRVWATERIFRVLGLLYEATTIYHAYLALTGTDKRRVDSALEFLDATLTPEHRSRILGLLEFPSNREKPSLAARKNVLFGYVGAHDELPASAMVADFSEAEFYRIKKDIGQVLTVFTDLPLINETFQWRCVRMDPDYSEDKLTTIQKLDFLHQVDIFDRLGPQELLLLANHSVECHFEPGATIFQEGEAGEELYILAKGRVELKRRTGHASFVTPGQTFSTLSVVSDQPRLFTAYAVTACLCLKISKAPFWEILEDYPSVSLGIFKVLANRIRELTE